MKPINRRLRALSATVVLLSSAAVVRAADDDLLKDLRPAHPRLMVLDDQMTAVKRIISSDPQAADTFARLQKEGRQMLTQPTAEHVLIGPRLLAQSRAALKVISTTAGMYRLTGDAAYARRARQEMLTVAAFKDWNPSHFLDVAEMTNACGIGYDWIYDQLSPNERKTIRDAIVEKGLKAGLEAYRKHAFWTDCAMNWGQVCAGGLTVGALAIADEEPELSEPILKLTRQTMIKPMQQFAPDGGWDEGPGYWNYATSYNVFYLSAVESALGTDFGFDQQPGFSQTDLFHMELTGPTNKMFNFADAGDGLEPAPQIFWLAKKFNRPTDAAWERSHSAGHMNIFHLLWFNTDGQRPAKQDPLPLDMLFKRVNVGVLRSGFTDSNAWFIGFKGGDNAANHSHLDLGSFVLDAMGQRWAVDMGPDNYNLPGYFGQQRFTYYRLSTRAHNTITLNGANQNPKAKAEIISFTSDRDRAAAIIDLSAAYSHGSVRRGIAMIDRKQILIQDEIGEPEAASVEWNFHTPARVEISGNKATLSLGGARLLITLLSPADGKFEVTPCDAPEPQNPNPGISDLMVRCGGSPRMAVLFSGVGDGDLPGVKPLAEWDQSAQR